MMITQNKLSRLVTLMIFLVGMLGGMRPVSAYAQGGSEPNLPVSPTLHFTHLTTTDGLSHNAITDIVQDRRGFMWIGTRDGLNRFDGYRFTTYRYEPNNPGGLSDGHVRAITEDSHGALWVATQGGGLNHFDPDTETFTHYRYTPGRASGLRSDTTFCVLQDRAGNLWIGGPPPVELTSLDASQVAAPAARGHVTRTFRYHDLDVNVGKPTLDETASFGFRGGGQALVEDASGHLWLAADLALIRFDPDSEGATAYVPHPQESRLNAIARDATGNLWVGGSTGLYKFDPTAEQFTGYDLDFEVEALYVDGETLWIGGPGLYALDMRSERIVQQAVHQQDNPDSLSGEIVTVIYKDAGGVLWVGTSEGVSLFDPRQTQFSHYHHDPDDASSLADNQVQAIAGGATGAVWLVTPQVLERFDPATGEVTHYFPKSSDTPFLGLGLSALCSDREGDVWAGAGDHLYRLDVERGTFEVYDALRARAQLGPPPLISDIVEDEDGNVWIAMTLVGLHRFDRQNGNFHILRRGQLPHRRGQRRPQRRTLL